MDMPHYVLQKHRTKIQTYQIVSYFKPFEPKFYSDQLLSEHFIVKINNFRVISQNSEVIDISDVGFYAVLYILIIIYCYYYQFI